MKIACVGYRDWAIEIYESIQTDDREILLITSKSDLDYSVLQEFGPDYVLFYGWSWIVPEQFITSFRCLMLHPSPLPKYRGGSPIQNQIINGEIESAVSIFLMDSGLDSGPLYCQESFSLEGELSEIFSRIVRIGIALTEKILSEDLQPFPQDHSLATYFKRRKAADSEISMQELKTSSAEFLYNKIRMLQDPYPNAYIVAADGRKIFLKSASINDPL